MADANKPAPAAAPAKEPHVCRRPNSCVCSISALEPADDCPIHSGGEWPPRCADCGKFMPWPKPAPAAAPDALIARLDECIANDMLPVETEMLREAAARLSALIQERDVWRDESRLMAAHQGIDNYQRLLDYRAENATLRERVAELEPESDGTLRYERDEALRHGREMMRQRDEYRRGWNRAEEMQAKAVAERDSISEANDMLLSRAETAEASLAKANALLREMRTQMAYFPDLDGGFRATMLRMLDAHLSGAQHG